MVDNPGGEPLLSYSSLFFLDGKGVFVVVVLMAMMVVSLIKNTSFSNTRIITPSNSDQLMASQTMIKEHKKIVKKRKRKEKSC